MKVRGRRRCTECGNRWSYFETGATACPACGSLRSVGVDEERALHTDSVTSLDLSAARSMLGEHPVGEVAGVAASAARDYLHARGFVRGGELLALDETVLLAAELRHVAGRIERALDVDEAEERHFLDLLAGAESAARPDDVPRSLREARGLAAVDTVSAYRRDLSEWLDEQPSRRVDVEGSGGDPADGEGDDGTDPAEGPEETPRSAVRRTLSRLDDHERRISALDGDVPPADADALVDAARGIGEYLREGDEAALARARRRLDALE